MYAFFFQGRSNRCLIFLFFYLGRYTKTKTINVCRYIDLILFAPFLVMLYDDEHAHNGAKASEQEEFPSHHFLYKAKIYKWLNDDSIYHIYCPTSTTRALFFGCPLFPFMSYKITYMSTLTPEILITINSIKFHKKLFLFQY